MSWETGAQSGARDGNVRLGVIWFTGLPGAGKTTLAGWVADHLRAQGLRVEQLDGDVIRRIFPGTGYTRPERESHIQQMGYLASRLEHHGVIVVAAFVSPYQSSRLFVRRLCANFFEIYVATPVEICEQRDKKGLYAKARRGEIKNFTGVDDPYESPSNPELVIDTTALTVEQAGRSVLRMLQIASQKRV
jgi:adenylylsulfate kinase